MLEVINLRKEVINMPLGGFLDTFPAGLFIVAHVFFLVVALWAWKKAKDSKLAYADAFCLYGIAQLIFLGFFIGFLTMKMAVLLEQMLMVAMVVWIISKVGKQA